MSTTTAADVLDALRRDLIRRPEVPAGLLLSEVGSPDGKRRADALWLPCVAGLKGGIDGYEVKVSRPDVLAELADPFKAQSWKQYCRRWWLALPDASLIEGLEVPDDWGVKVMPTAGNRRMFTVVKPAPELEPAPLGPALARITTFIAYKQAATDRQVEFANHALDDERANRAAIVARETQYKAREVSPHEQLFNQVGEALNALKGGHHLNPFSGHRPEEIAEAILHVRQARKIRDHAARTAKQQLDMVSYALRDLRDSHQYRELELLLNARDDQIGAV
jgi:hypothetical protein